MRIAGAVIAAVLFSLLAISPLPAQDEHRDAPAPEKQETKPAPEPHAAPQPEARPPQDAKPSHPQEARPQGNEQRPEPAQQQQKQEQKQAVQQQKQAQKTQQKQAEQQQKQAKQQQHAQQEQAKRAQTDNHPAPAEPQRDLRAQNAPPQNPGGPHGGGRIPDDRFRANFGREHHFHIGHPVVVEGQPRFQYSGYWFAFVDPWPVGWSYDDDCYIDYVDGGYWLFDPVHPGMRIAIMVVL